MTRCHLVGERQGAVGVAEVVEECAAGDRHANCAQTSVSDAGALDT